MAWYSNAVVGTSLLEAGAFQEGAPKHAVLLVLLYPGMTLNRKELWCDFFLCVRAARRLAVGL